MNKNRGIWLVIGGILVIGMLVTFATSNFVKNRESIPGTAESSLTSGTELQDAVPDGDSGQAPQLFSADAGTSGEKSAQSQAAKARTAGPASMKIEAAMGETQEPAPDEDTQEKSEAASPQEESQQVLKSFAEPVPQETVLSPIDPDGKNRAYAGTDASEGAAFYREHLAELDVQIKKMWEESGDSNTYSMKALAEKELKLWNRAQTEIYTAVSDGLDSEARQALEDSQQAWIKSRDAKAEEDSKKYSGGSLEELEYTMSLAASTKARAYDLVAGYME